MLPFPGWSSRGVRPFFIQVLLMKKILQWMASPRLACALMAYAVLLIFLGTLEARLIGVSAVQARYFESWGCLSFGMIPLIGGAGVGALAVLNISASVFRRARFTLRGVGVILTHAFLIVLILAGTLQYFLRTEGILVLDAGEVSHEVLVGEGNGRKNIPLGFSVELKKFDARTWTGSDIPSSFSSEVCFMRGGESTETVIRMNAPVTFGGWIFYQSSYANEGRTSVIAAVRNPVRFFPWISVPGVFAGMLLIFLPTLRARKKHAV